MESLLFEKQDSKKTTSEVFFSSRAAKWFKNRGMSIFNYQDDTIRKTIIKNDEKFVWAISPNGGKTEMSICFIDLYLQDNPTHKVLILTHNTKVLRDNYYQRILEKNPTFTHQEVTANNEVLFDKQVIVSLPSTLIKRKLPKFNLIVIDEAHHMYEKKGKNKGDEVSRVKKIIKKCEIRKELLLTGTPSLFIRKNKEANEEIYKFIFVPMSKVFKETDNCSDVIVELATSIYQITDDNYRNDELNGSFVFKKEDTYKTLDNTFLKLKEALFQRVTSPIRNSKNFSLKEQFKPISQPFDWEIFKKEMGKTLIACNDQPQAKQVANYFKEKGFEVALSISDDDPNNLEIKKFQGKYVVKDKNTKKIVDYVNNLPEVLSEHYEYVEYNDCKILIVVMRGILGFSEKRIMNVIDMSMTKNIDRMYQLFCRATRKLNNKNEKLFIKVFPSDREQHFKIRVAGMLCLMHEYWFSKFDGKNFLELDIPIKKQSEPKEGGPKPPPPGPRTPIEFLGCPVMSLFEELYNKKDKPYSPCAWTKVGTVLRVLDGLDGKRGVINEEVIEDLYCQHKNKTLKEMNIVGGHIINKARVIGVHDKLIKKYNIQLIHNRSEEKYLPLLKCENHKDVIDKGLKSIHGRLLATKDKELIKKYTEHFKPLKPRAFTDEDAMKYLNKLKEYPRGINVNHPDSGIYRHIFNMQKEKYYGIILKKWGYDVPMSFLNDEDKIKKIQKEINGCKDYYDWYKQYVSSHKKILKRLDKMYLLDSLVKQRNITRSKESMIILLKENEGRFIQDFRNSHQADYTWLIKNNGKHLLYQYLKKQRK